VITGVVDDHAVALQSPYCIDDAASQVPMDGERERRAEFRGEARLDAAELWGADEDEEGRVDGQRVRIECA
jgi:hypothetical protein